MEAPLNRLHALLVDAIRQNRPDTPSRPITVAEIYQDLIPYRQVRSELGIELNADYEHALLRMLAGEGSYLRIDPPEAQEELARELESRNPNVGIFRRFAGCDVWVDLDRPPVAQRAAPAAAPIPVTQATAPARTHAPVPPGKTAPGQDAQQPARAATAPLQGAAGAAAGAPQPRQPLPTSQATRPAAPATPVAAAAATEGKARVCGFCSGTLPVGRDVRFCPFCGADQRRRRCASCGEVLESDWRFCIACGHG
jgi:hypothetical protein